MPSALAFIRTGLSRGSTRKRSCPAGLPARPRSHSLCPNAERNQIPCRVHLTIPLHLAASRRIASRRVVSAHSVSRSLCLALPSLALPRIALLGLSCLAARSYHTTPDFVPGRHQLGRVPVRSDGPVGAPGEARRLPPLRRHHGVWVSVCHVFAMRSEGPRPEHLSFSACLLSREVT